MQGAWSHSLTEKLDLIRIYLNEQCGLVVVVSPWIGGLVLGAIVVAWWWTRRGPKRFKLESLDINLGGIGKASLRPTLEDVQVAHKIWTELVTRKAAMPIDPEHDVIVEVYNSWYALFGRVRELIAELPPHLVREDPATRELIRIAIESLNKGLRPHLTRWQARFRNWYAQQEEKLKTQTPQEVQKQFPEYEALMSDMRTVNQQLIQYAEELQKIARGS